MIVLPGDVIIGFDYTHLILSNKYWKYQYLSSGSIINHEGPGVKPTRGYTTFRYRVFKNESLIRDGMIIKPCRALWEDLVQNNPIELINVIRLGKLKSTDKTFACETLGDIDRELPDWLFLREKAIDLLLKICLDSCEVPVTREGAFYGLHRLGLDEFKMKIVFQVFLESNSQALKEIAHSREEFY